MGFQSVPLHQSDLNPLSDSHCVIYLGHLEAPSGRTEQWLSGSWGCWVWVWDFILKYRSSPRVVDGSEIQWLW